MFIKRIAIDPIFPPPFKSNYVKKEIPDCLFENNKFELIFDELVDG